MMINKSLKGEMRMKIRILNDDGDLLWEREKNKGVTSRTYAKDGTLIEIISALKEALIQAEGELLSFNYADGMADSGASTA